MATYIMLGRYSQDALGKLSAERTQKATALIEQNGGKLREGYALLGKTDLVLIVDLPDTERAMKTSVALSRLLGVSFATMPAVTVAEFDRLLA